MASPIMTWDIPFDGWRQQPRIHGLDVACPVADAKTWLLAKGWRRHGLLDLASTDPPHA